MEGKNKSGVAWSDPVAVKKYKKEYNSRPEVKARQKEYMKEYFSRPEVKARNAKNRFRSPGHFVTAFKEGWDRKWSKEKENKKAMAELFLDTVCEYDLTDKERCGLIEEMLKKETKKEGG